MNVWEQMSYDTFCRLNNKNRERENKKQVQKTKYTAIEKLSSVCRWDGPFAMSRQSEQEHDYTIYTIQKLNKRKQNTLTFDCPPLTYILNF